MEDFKKYEGKAEVLKALAHPHRLCIVKGLLENKCNVTKMQECLGLPQSTVSQHLAKLKAAGIINGDRRGIEVCYSVTNPIVAEIVKIILEE
ncbi:ArsR family transcriptional regulator [Anaerobacterium chartisolvens]|uniref:ArsR family transcriptional regulator n=1 Tax=Anaerobacterium chartisolvens TaxID=1297424 RepID=A0A369BB64_9FIRM|nr:metalloregulator ArsR/SmtB family transcription factor [Anaerobacterium chartisolvens]RCX17838.1 ArsR family transcriptional regulator [Anaerobacterium chartisolvens]